MKTQVHFRANPLTKKRARKVLERLGLDLSTGLNTYLHYVATHGSIPFELDLPKSGRKVGK